MGTKAASGFFKGTKGNTVAGDANFMSSNDGCKCQLKNVVPEIHQET